MNNYRYIGKSISDDITVEKVTGRLKFVSDMDSPEMLHLRFKRSEVSHGIIKEMDVSQAEKYPGVVKVYTPFNTSDQLYDSGRVSRYELAFFNNQERLLDPHVLYYGCKIAAVVAKSPEIAERACQLIKVEYEELPVAGNMEAAAREDAYPIFERGNVYPVEAAVYGNYDTADSDYTFFSEIEVGRMTHLSMETQCARARYEYGKLTIWSGTQTVFGIRSTVADLLGMPYSKVRVIKAPMGGSFGCKQEMVVEPMCAYAAKDLEADVRLVYSREDQILNAMLKHNFISRIESKFGADGVIQGIRVRTDMEAGAYLTVTPDYLGTMSKKFAKVYRIQHIDAGGRVICTNTPVNGSFRSWGSCEAAAVMESHLNLVARKLKIDPIDLRLKNVLQPHDQDIMQMASVGESHFAEVLEQGRERFQWEERKRTCQQKNKQKGRYRYGVGMALTSHTTSFYPYRPDLATATIVIQDDGSLIVRVPVHDHGCGTVLAMKKIAGEIFELDLQQIALMEADTENMTYDYGCFASRTIYALGHAVKKCAQELLEKTKKIAGILLGGNATTVRYERGTFYSEKNPEKRITLRDVWEYSIFTLGQDLYHTISSNATISPGVPAAHFSQVKVDTYTGQVEIEHCLSVHDVGKTINPDMCIGQVGSGIQQGIGMALCEEIKIHPESGKTLITNLKNYEVANACDLPDYDTLFIEEVDPTGPFGAKGIGEVVVAPVAPAILEAVNDALNMTLNSLPLTPAKILAALEEIER